jgi:DNA-binding XRE family transcriptional regulator
VIIVARTLEQILADEKPEVVAQAREQADAMLLNIHLAELRELVDKTQMEIAEALGVKQPTIAEMEKVGRDIKLSSLKRYVEATGGKLRLDIELPNGTHWGFSV